MKFLNKEFIKKHISFFILIPLVFISQVILLSPDLNNGLDDTADQYTAGFKQLREISSNPVQLISETRRLPILWIHEYYYMGVLNYFLDDNFVAYHQVAHFLKSLASISTYPLFFILTGSTMIAFTSSLVFAISYSSAGSLDPLVVNGDYIGIVFLSIFFTIYFYLVRKETNSGFFIYLLGLIFLILTLSIATTRSFPVIFLILGVEIIATLKDRRISNLKLGFKRILVFLLPILLIIIIKPDPVTQRVNDAVYGLNSLIFSSSSTTSSLNSDFKGGEYELLLIPFMSFASTILPVRLWPVTTISILFVLTIIFGLLLSKKPLRFIMVTIFMWFLGFLYVNWSWSNSSTHNLKDLGTKSIIGFYFLSLAVSFFIEWLQNKSKLYIGLFLGPFFSFIFIFSTWLMTQERLLLFINIHRYLTISSIFISFFIGSLIVVLSKEFKEHKPLKFLEFSPFFLLPVFFIISSSEINDFYDVRAQEGNTLQDQDYMRRQLVPYLSDIKRPRLIYIDVHTDKVNSYYYGQVYHYGPLFWMTWYDKKIDDCTVPRSVLTYDLMKSSIKTRDDITGIFYQGWFYRAQDIRAVRLINKQAIDIKDEVVKDLSLTESDAPNKPEIFQIGYPFCDHKEFQ